MPDKEKEKWAKVLHADLMSSEDSEGGGDDIIIVKPLQWRSTRVAKFLHTLDVEGKTMQAKRQRKQLFPQSAQSHL